ncbi:hypothetical protein ACFYPZ_29590 [Streptomyces sp. NPDC005506]
MDYGHGVLDASALGYHGLYLAGGLDRLLEHVLGLAVSSASR